MFFPVSTIIARISLACIGLMWVLPFLYFRHAYPITTFYQEWGAGVLGLSAMTLLLAARFWQAPAVPRLLLLPIGLLFILLLQFLLGRITQFDHLMLVAQYLLFAALLLTLGQHLREMLGLPAVVATLAIFLLVGAELNTLAGILQQFRWNTFLNPVVTAKTSNAVYGNLAQPNHFADYISLALISLGLLYQRFSMRRWLVLLCALPMLYVLVLSGSRSSWLYLPCATLLAYFWQRRAPQLRPLFLFSLAVLLGFALMHLLVLLPWLQGNSGSVTTTERMFAADTSSGGIRLHLWYESLLIFLKFPLLGAGFGQFGYQHFLLATQMHDPSIVGLYNNAHNLVMQIGAETGLAGLLVLLLTLGQWLRQAFYARQYDAEHWWGYAVLAVLGIHSLLEYPLWYLHFLGLAAITLGLFDTTRHALELRNVGRAAVALILVLGAVSLVQVWQGYMHLENALVLRGMEAKDPSLGQSANEELLATRQNSLLGSYADLFITSRMQISADHLQEKLDLNQRAMVFIPIAPIVYHQAWLLALADRLPEARVQLERAIWAYPLDYAMAHGELTELARKDPAHFSALLEFATQKYEEYQRAAVPGT